MTSESLNNTNIHGILSLLGYKALFVHFHFFSAILYIDICLGTGVNFQRKIKQKKIIILLVILSHSGLLAFKFKLLWLF